MTVRIGKERERNEAKMKIVKERLEKENQHWDGGERLNSEPHIQLGPEQEEQW